MISSFIDDTLDIPFMVYDPDTEKCNVTFFVNDERIATDELGMHKAETEDIVRVEMNGADR